MQANLGLARQESRRRHSRQREQHLQVPRGLRVLGRFRDGMMRLAWWVRPLLHSLEGR